MFGPEQEDLDVGQYAVAVSQPHVTIDWATRTGGDLSRTERLAMLRPIAGSVVSYIADRLPPHRSTGVAVPDPIAPDSKFARQVEECAAEQSPALLGHGYRTWIFGACFSELDSVAVDPELLYAAALLHDSGLMTSVVGEDFTIRSAEVVRRACTDADEPARATAISNAVVAHATPGLRPDTDPLGYYVQTGALADLTGLRSRALAKEQLQSMHDLHPRHGANRVIPQAIRREARAVPHGRFALLRRCGFPLLIAVSPTRKFQ